MFQPLGNSAICLAILPRNWFVDKNRTQAKTVSEQTPDKTYSKPARRVPVPTIYLPQSPNELLKPRELIEIRVDGNTELSLWDRRIYNKLLHNAHGPGLAQPGAVFSIPMSVLRVGHTSNDRIGKAILRLMQTIVTIKRQDNQPGGQVQLLGWNNFNEPARNHGYLRYSIDHRLCEILSHSFVFAKLQVDVMQAFRSRFSFSLYEAIALRSRLKHVQHEQVKLKDLREQFLGVGKGKFKSFGTLRQTALDVAVAEVNALASFNVDYTPYKEGRSIGGVYFVWRNKTEDELRAQYAELQHRQPIQRDLFPQTLID